MASEAAVNVSQTSAVCWVFGRTLFDKLGGVVPTDGGGAAAVSSRSGSRVGNPCVRARKKANGVAEGHGAALVA